MLFDGLDLRLPIGESAAVMGPSGSGKSTLISCALGLVKPQGSVTVADADLTGMRRRQLARHRSRYTGVVFQFGELLPELTALENVALAALLAGTSRKDAYADAERLLVELGVPRAKRPTGTLSGGERQRTAVARALINKPALLLADEPTGALDDTNRNSVAELLFKVPKQWECALLVVTHDEQVAMRADRVFHLADGHLLERSGG
ncbi:ABC transporter ATP-binding protein [Streptomyces avidinii]|uniref:ABC-type lipoprotein export system ATPase subunit n=1 Tax=Streptomyces avidinii TaxID=1895 RepID=A0ABS4LAZ0_STRAV|nr:ABC transporter ATP-binding protein [Streptomyces avidinii]MBP2039298.1 ABC-type lipoprotein export system ATPase subunit [Streptomyces avidinii]GGZ30214.1 lipoprotein-releasing system ATP-binding protein LolD [Streptomyces avidinii]